MEIKSWSSPFKLSVIFEEQLSCHGIQKTDQPVYIDEDSKNHIVIFPELYRLTSFPNLRKFKRKDIEVMTRMYESVLSSQLHCFSYSQCDILRTITINNDAQKNASMLQQEAEYHPPGKIKYLTSRIILDKYQDLLNTYSKVVKNAQTPSRYIDYYSGTLTQALNVATGEELLDDWWHLQSNTVIADKCATEELLLISIEKLVAIDALADSNYKLRRIISTILKQAQIDNSQ